MRHPAPTDEQLKFIRSGYLRMYIPQLTAEFNAKFNQQRSESAIRSIIRRMKFKSSRKPGKVDGFRFCSYEQARWIAKQYKKLSRVQLTDAYNKKYGTNKTVKQITAFVKNHRILSGRNGQFNPQQTPWNKGTVGVMRGNKSSFITGNRPANNHPIGHERIDNKDGYVWVKVDEQNPYTGYHARFRQKHIITWEQHFGTVKDNHCIVFKNGQRDDCRIENLEMISRHELLMRNHLKINQAPDEHKPVLRSIAKLLTKIHQRSSHE